jgi:hypothetical protein
VLLIVIEKNDKLTFGLGVTLKMKHINPDIYYYISNLALSSGLESLLATAAAGASKIVPT